MTATNTPQAILDAIARYEAEIALKQEEIARHGLTISNLQERVLHECRLQDAIQDNINLLRFAVAEYEKESAEAERVDLARPIGNGIPAAIADTEAPEEATEQVVAAPIEPEVREPATPLPLKERVYYMMREAHRPMRAPEIAARLGTNSSAVGTCFGHLSRAKKIKPLEDGAWIARD